MLEPTPVREQTAAVAEDPIRVLIVGAGVAGVTAAQLLRGQGLHPVLVERAEEQASHGYMLALMPMVDPVLRELEVREEYVASSVEVRRFGVRAHTGRLLRADPLAGILGRFGDYRGISRGQLLTVLAGAGGAVSYDTTVAELHQPAAEVGVTLRCGAEHIAADFDLVIVADGMRSATRDLVQGAERLDTLDTGWSGWVVWAEPDADTDLGEELWGAGLFVGSYPVKDRLGVFLGGPRSDTDLGRARFVSSARRKLTTLDARVDRILDTVARSESPYYWPMTDCRASTWSAGRVALLGDAAAGFLPTAGIGAGMAIESAWVLAGGLRDATAGDVPSVLRAYERAQRPRVEAAHRNSRRLARLMFRRSKTLATVRDLASALVSVDKALGPIKKLLETGPASASSGRPGAS